MRNGGAAHKKAEAPRSINEIMFESEWERVSRLGVPNIVLLTANDKDFSLTLEMTIRGSLKSPSLQLLEIPNP